MLRRVESGQGLVGKLLIDEKYGRETSASLANAVKSVERLLGQIDEGVRTGNGAIPALLSDPDGKQKVYALVDSLAVAAGNLARVTENLEKGNGALPILLHDEEFGRAFTGNLRSFAKSLDSIGKKLDDGTGTAGKLINDPSLFDAANRLAVGVNESALLRWLIKDRQKAGIKKEYDEYTRTPTPTPHTHRRAVNLLVTGGAGFIGSHLADRRRRKGDRVVVLDDFNDFYDPRLKRANVAAHRERRRLPAGRGRHPRPGARVPALRRGAVRRRRPPRGASRGEAVAHAAGAVRGGQLPRDVAPARGRRRRTG